MERDVAIQIYFANDVIGMIHNGRQDIRKSTGGNWLGNKQQVVANSMLHAGAHGCIENATHQKPVGIPPNCASDVCSPIRFVRSGENVLPRLESAGDAGDHAECGSPVASPNH